MNLPWSHTPFAYRLAVLLALMAAAAFFDWWRQRGAATRWREYSFLLVAGALGALIGTLNDALTSWLSPEYFEIGKGLAPGPGLRLRAMALGAQAGFAAAFIAGACYLFANNPKPGLPALGYAALFRRIGWPVGGALGCGILFGTGALVWAKPDLHAGLREVTTPEQALWFWRVWFIHLGLYAGLAAGVAWGVAGIRRDRKRRP